MPREIFNLSVPKVTRANIRGVPIASANKTIKVSVRCSRRAKLYVAELRQAQQDIRAMYTPGGPNAVDPRLWYALSGERLVDLLTSLADILDDYVAFGVREDFQVGGVGAAEATYAAYFDHQIDVGGGVGAFLGRYPLLQSAITTLRQYFVTNIALACARITADWAEIEHAFLNTAAGDALVALAEMEATGSDFHKHGKQVILLTFAYTAAVAPALALGRRRASSGERRAIARRTGNALNHRPYLVRVVYKPSDIEIDCRIMGNVGRLIAARGAAGFVAAENPPIAQSLMELVNQILGYTGTVDELPTYTILPHSSGSSIVANPPGAALGNCYGYIEFLTHEPRAKRQTAGAWNDATATNEAAAQATAACNATPGWNAAFDWVTDDPNVVRRCFETWGRLAAIAVVFSIADMHVQNVIMHKCKPHLIDLEDAIKWRMTGVGSTGMFGAGTPSCDNLKGPNPMLNSLTNDKTKQLTCMPIGGENKLASTVLYYRAAGVAAVRVTKATPARVNDMHNGFTEIMDMFGNAVNNGLLDGWAAANLPNVITRFVAFPTLSYYNQLANFILLNAGQAPPNPAIVGAFNNFNGWHFEGSVRGQRGLWLGAARVAGDDEELRQWREGYLPGFALDHPDYHFRDLVSWDIPSFYRRLGTIDLLASDGNAVDPHAAWVWQNARLAAHALAGGPAAVAVPLEPYFANEAAAEAAAVAASPGAVNVVAHVGAIPNAVSGAAAARAAALLATAPLGAIHAAATAASVVLVPPATPVSVSHAAAVAAATVAAPVRMAHFFAEDAVTMVRRQITRLVDVGVGVQSPERIALEAACLAGIP